MNKPNLVQRIGLALGFAGAVACGGNGAYQFPEKLPSQLSPGKDLLTNIVSSSDVIISPSGNYSYNMTFTNKQGLTFTFPLAANVTDPQEISNIFGHWGSEAFDLHFKEQAPGKFPIELGDDIVLSDGDVSNVLSFSERDFAGNSVTFYNRGTSSFQQSAIDPFTNTFSLIVGGQSYSGNVDTNTTKIEIDLNNSGSIVSGEKANIITKAGAEIEFSDVAGYKHITYTTKAANVLTPASLPCPDEKIQIHIDASEYNKPIRIADVNVEMTETASGSGTYTGKTAFGLDLTLRDPQPEDLTITEYERQ